MTALRTLPCPSALVFKRADHPEEFEAIHRLNHRTFAEEIPQHETNPEGRLVDRFHGQNVYLIALDGASLEAMVALRFDRPFSVEQKAPGAMAQLPDGQRWCEIRLLAVEPRHRGSGLLAGLLRLVVSTTLAHGCDAALISATTRQLKLYGHLGFTPFGPLIGREGAWYQPMWNTVARLAERMPFLTSRPADAPVNLLPGPVAVPAYVREAFQRPAISHRAPAALAMVREIRDRLTALTGAPHVALLAGGGTLANDVVAAQLRRLQLPGAVVVSGEFGRRLADHAARAGLTFITLSFPEGTGPGAAETADFLREHPSVGWLWLTHCETSTGVLHPLTEIARVCADRGVKLCVDAVSSPGVVPVDLSGVWLASGASGKGLAAYPGVALVFSSQGAAGGSGLPRALDLGLYLTEEGMPFTLSSNLIAALHAALTLTDWPAKISRTARHGARLRESLLKAGFDLSGNAASQASPAVLTLNLPAEIDAAAIAGRAEENGFLLAAHSSYLKARNQAQICLMGELRERDTRRLPDLLSRLRQGA